MVNESAEVVFDDQRAVANAGVMLPALLAQRLGIEELVEETVDLGVRPGAAQPRPEGNEPGLGDGVGRGLHR